MKKDKIYLDSYIVLNQQVNIQRKEYEQLKAILHNCKTKGIASQGEPEQLKAWLAGKIAYIRMINPQKANKLQLMFDAIIHN